MWSYQCDVKNNERSRNHAHAHVELPQAAASRYKPLQSRPRACGLNSVSTRITSAEGENHLPLLISGFRRGEAECSDALRCLMNAQESARSVTLAIGDADHVFFALLRGPRGPGLSFSKDSTSERYTSSFSYFRTDRNLPRLASERIASAVTPRSRAASVIVIISSSSLAFTNNYV